MEKFFVHRQRTICIRPDLLGAVQVRDVLTLEPDGRLMETAMVYADHHRVLPVFTHLAYRVRYEKSPRGQIHWKPAHADCIRQTVTWGDHLAR